MSVEKTKRVESARMKRVAEEADIKAKSLSSKWETTVSVAEEEVAMRKANADIVVVGNNSRAAAAATTAVVVVAEPNCS